MGVLTRLVLLLELLYPALAAPVDATPPNLPRITSVKYSGNGCPDDATRSGGFNDPTFEFDAFTASYPGSEGRTANCEVHVQADRASAGWQVALSQVNVDGHLVLDPGTRADFYVQTFYSQDATVTGTTKGWITNDEGSRIDRSVTIRQKIDDKIWSPCIGSDGSPGILNVNFRVALNGDGRGYFRVRSENWDFVWRRC